MDRPLLILWRPAYDLLLQYAGSDCRRVIEESKGYREYPNGSAQIQDQVTLQEVWRVMATVQQRRQVTLFEDVRFRSIAAFERVVYHMRVPIGYFEACKEMGPAILPMEHESESRCERELGCLEVSVQFVGRARGSVQSEFCKHVTESSARIFPRVGGSKSRPAAIADIEFPGHRAFFHIDASGTNQFAINAFTLSILDFGLSVLPVSAVAYGRGAEGYPVGEQPDISAGLRQWKEAFPWVSRE